MSGPVACYVVSRGARARNEVSIKHLLTSITADRFSSVPKVTISFGSISSDDDLMDEEGDSDDGSGEVDDDSELEIEAPPEEETKAGKKSISSVKETPVRKSIVDDSFFRLGKLEEFLEIEDKKEERKLRKQRKSE